jgi:hypothetical protein
MVENWEGEMEHWKWMVLGKVNRWVLELGVM